MSHVSRFTILSIGALLGLGMSSSVMAQDLPLAMPSIRDAIQNLPPATASVASRQTVIPPEILFPFPRHSSSLGPRGTSRRR